MSVIALVRVYGGSAGEQAVRPELSWFTPPGSTPPRSPRRSSCASSSTGAGTPAWRSAEETKDAEKTPGRAALLSTVILLFTYLLVAVAVQAFAGFGDTGIGLNNEENSTTC